MAELFGEAYDEELEKWEGQKGMQGRTMYGVDPMSGEWEQCSMTVFADDVC